ncbi:MAG: hypothetical protein JO057_03045 [Chloroflexi bacterium]|nr:hypothetical protein [Chloroflexota bacterium]
MSQETSPELTGSDTATLRFKRDQQSSGISRVGQLRPGRRVRVEYDLARLIPDEETGAGPVHIVCHVLFQPGGEQGRGTLQPAAAAASSEQRRRSATFEIAVPPETTSLEVWFERIGPSGTTGWDSRVGQNFRFPVTQTGLSVPEASVNVRSGAGVDPIRIHVVDDAASKAQATVGASGTRLQTDLVVRARLGAVEDRPLAWADVHVFDATGELIHSETIALHESEDPADHALRIWQGSVYQGSGGGSGVGVWSRPDAHTVQYRVYCQIGTEVYTDGVLHQFEVPADADVRPIPGGV